MSFSFDENMRTLKSKGSLIAALSALIACILQVAGLIRYFDAEEKTSLKIPPWFVAVMCIATIVIVIAAHIIWPLS